MKGEVPKVTVKVIPEIDTSAVMESLAEIEHRMYEAVQALAPVMQQLSAAFREFGQAGGVLAARLSEMSKQQTDEQRRHLENLKQQLTAGMVSRETVDAAIRKMEGREPVEKHIHPRDGGPMMTFRQEYYGQLPPITREEWEKYVSGKPPVKPVDGPPEGG